MEPISSGEADSSAQSTRSDSVGRGSAEVAGQPGQAEQEAEPMRRSTFLAVSAGILLSGILAGGCYAQRKEKALAEAIEADGAFGRAARNLTFWNWIFPSKSLGAAIPGSSSDYYERLRREYHKANSAPDVPLRSPVAAACASDYYGRLRRERHQANSVPADPSDYYERLRRDYYQANFAPDVELSSPAAVSAEATATWPASRVDAARWHPPSARPLGAAAAARNAGGAVKTIQPDGAIMAVKALAIATTGWAVVGTAVVFGVREILGVKTVKEFHSWMHSKLCWNDRAPPEVLEEEATTDAVLVAAFREYLGITPKDDGD